MKVLGPGSAWLLRRRGTTGRRGTAGLALVLLAAGGTVPVLGALAGGPAGGGAREVVPITEVPSDTPRLGLVYQGLAPAQHGTPCVGAYQVVAPDMCSHGPDEPPAGLDVRRDVAPVADSEPTPTLPRQNIAAVPGDNLVGLDAGAVPQPDTARPVDEAPAFVPDAPADTTRPDGVVCDGDGSAGRRVQVLYVYQTGTASRFSQYLGSFQAWAAGVDRIFDASAAETGGSRHVRYVTTPDCAVAVAEVEVPAGALDTLNATITVLRSLGYDRADRKYMIFAEANVYCGIATFARDDRAGPDNRSDRGPGYGRSDAGCWSPAVAAHELAHNLGAVHNGAPHSSHTGHCVDGYDLMCHGDPGSDVNRGRPRCPNRADAQRLDCHHDDYFSTDPKPGSYLDRHWNVADSQFLVDGAGGGAAEPAGPDPAAPDPTVPAPPAPTQATPAPTTSEPASPATPAEPPGKGNPQHPPGRGPDKTPPGSPATPPPSTGAGPGGHRGPPATPPAAAAPSPSAPAPPPAATPVPLQVDATSSTAVRVAWEPAGHVAQYGVLVDGAVVGWTTATAGRVIGLRPDTTYRLQVVTGGPDTGARQYTEAGTAHTPAVHDPPSGEWFTLDNALTGGTATLYGARAGGGAPLVLQPGTGAANQVWRLQPAGDGTYLLRSRATGKCVVPRGGRAVAGAPLVQQSCPSLPAAGQLWRVMSTAYGFSLAAAGLDDKPAGGGSLVIGVGVLRFGGHRVLALQRPAPARHQSWTSQ